MLTARRVGALSATFLLLCAARAEGGGISVFTDQGAFEQAATGASKQLKFIETFEESNVGPGQVAQLTPPLQPGVPNIDAQNGLGFPNGLAATNIQLRTDTGQFLVAVGDGTFGNSTVVVGANDQFRSTIIEVLPGGPAKTAIGLNIEHFLGAGNYDVTVRDGGGGVLFAGNVAAGAASGSFMGFLSPVGIGSIEVDATAGFELLDNIQLWNVPEPSCLLLLGVGLVAIRRR